MTFRSIVMVFLLSAATLLTSFDTYQPTLQGSSTLEIRLLNIRKGEGKLVVEVYKNNTSDWMETPHKKMTFPADAETKTISLPLPYGRYAIAIYQDLDNNGELKQNFLDIPREPVGFGNNHRPFGEPDFDDIAVDFTSSTKVQEIELYKVFF